MKKLIKPIIVGFLTLMVVATTQLFVGCKKDEATVTKSSKQITAFSFASLAPPLVGSINETTRTISFTAVGAISLADLVPTITHTGKTISPAANVAQDFSSPVVYTVTAEDGSLQVYTVTVTVLDVYIAGYQMNAKFIGDATKSVATYWKNGIPTALTNGTKIAIATSIKIVGSDVFVAGIEYNDSEKSVAKYWRNGTPTTLSDGTSNTNIADIQVVGNDVYVGGKDNGKATYWKNGDAVVLSSEPSTVTRLAIVGSDVHVIGMVKDQAKYWKNGVITELPLTGNTSYNAIQIVGNDVFIVGTELLASSISVVVYWKNGSKNTVTDGTKNCGGSSLAVIGNDVYIGGTEAGNATYWKNGTAVRVSSPSSALSEVYLYDIKVIGSDVYTVGHQDYAPAYWKNTSLTALTTTDQTKYGEASSIIIK